MCIRMFTFFENVNKEILLTYTAEPTTLMEERSLRSHRASPESMGRVKCSVSQRILHEGKQKVNFFYKFF